MNMVKRIFLFLAVNILVIFMLTLVLQILHVEPYLKSRGIDYSSLMIFCLVWGMGGALISLALSKTMAKWMMGVRIIDGNTTSPEEMRLLETVESLCRSAGMHHTPEVGIYNSAEPNAFATGPSEKRSLIAVSTGLLRKMSPTELEGVLSHELAHIANGDMVTMALLQGVVNAFVMFLARALAYVFATAGKNRNDSSPSYLSYTLFVFVFQFVFMILGSIVVAWFSRFREFRADAGGAHIAGREKMLSALQALQALQRTEAIHDSSRDSPSFRSMKIASGEKGGFLRLFASHPPLTERIARLQGE